jgi:hypothetical protein
MCGRSMQFALSGPRLSRVCKCGYEQFSERNGEQTEASRLQAIDENLRRMRHEQAVADLKRAEAEGDYETIRAAKLLEERLSYSE